MAPFQRFCIEADVIAGDFPVSAIASGGMKLLGEGVGVVRGRA